jgi:glycolate oxidase iron-sulfur subunit
VLFSEEDSRHEAAKTFSTKIRDLTEWLKNLAVPASATDAAIRVTYHDPCHASRGQGLVKEPRDILKKIPGIEYRELPEADWCCGGAGAYALSQYDLYRRVLDRKIANLKATEADIIATSCPACIIHLSYGLRKHGLKTRVCHISEIISGI